MMSLRHRLSEAISVICEVKDTVTLSPEDGELLHSAIGLLDEIEEDMEDE